MARVSIEIEPAQVEQIIRQMKEGERQYLIQKLVDDEFQTVAKKLRRNIRQQNFSAKDVGRIVEQARQEYHDRSRH